MITQAQVQNTLNLSGVFSLITGAASLTDNSGWNSLGVTSAAILLQIDDPTQDLVYQNSGYLTANYTSPDLNAPLGTTIFNFTLPVDINGKYLQGSYQINCSIQLISASGTQTFSVTVYQNVCSCCNGVVANVTPNINYLNAQVSVIDNTQYGNYQSVANTLTLYPPPSSNQSAQSQTFNGGPATLIWQPPMGQKTYTGDWNWTLSSVLTYIDPTTKALTTCLVTGNGNFEVNQNPICKVLCFLNNYVTKVQLAQKNSITNAAAMERTLLQAQGYFALLLGQNECGNNGQYYVEQIYRLIGVLNPDDNSCGCGCGGTNVTPLIPTQSINGTNGTNGLSFRQGVGVPSGSLGVIGDSYLDSSTGNIYKKTGATTWSLTENINGTNGNNIPPILYNHYAGVATPNTSLATLDNFNIPAAQFANVEDEVDVEATFLYSGAANSQTAQVVQVNIDSGVAIIPITLAIGIVRVKYLIKLVRVNSNTITYIATIKTYTAVGLNFVLHQEYDISAPSLTVNFANAINIAAQATSVVTGDLTSEYLSGTYFEF